MRRTIFFLIFCVAFITSAFAVDTLRISDISKVMEKLLHFHIENKELTPSLIRRSLKLYIEQFDSEKAYLLESEVTPYLQMSDTKATEICERVQRKNYSDFATLNAVIESAIIRAQNLRRLAVTELFQQEFSESPPITSLTKYPQMESEIVERQKGRMARFYLFHQNRSHIDSFERKISVYNLFEKKVRRFENSYLFLNGEGEVLSQAQVDHLLSLHILKAFAKSLDTHTAFFSPEEAYEMRLNLEKQFEGVGVVLSEGIDGVMIAELIEGGPAAQSGQIHVNDFLVEIDGKSLSSNTFEEVLDLLKKKTKEEITLGLKRLDPSLQKETFLRVALRKKPIAIKQDRIQSSFERVDGGIIGTITLRSFYENNDGVSSEKDIKEAIRNFRNIAPLKGLVLDLRENSGGFLGQAVRVAGLFVSNGIIVVSKYGQGDVHYLRNIVGKSYFDGPLVILTSKMSASASEIVAAALQDYGVALIVGDDRTFGKGSIQYQTITDESADLFFKVTVGRYYTVSGRSAQIDGVAADILVPTSYAPYNIGERFLEYPLAQDQVEPVYTDPLSDLDMKTRLLFEKRYLPSAQKMVTFWKTSLPLLRERSQHRIQQNMAFQKFLQKLAKIQARQSSAMVNSIDEPIEIGPEDLQMQEAVSIVRDMIELNDAAIQEKASVAIEMVEEAA